MIERYTRKVMGEVWGPESRFGYMLEVEKAVAIAQADLKLIPEKAARAIRLKGKFNVKRILELEQSTKHDVIAFVSNVAEEVGPEGRYVHFGLTSSDVLDTALSLQIRKAGEILTESLLGLLKNLEQLVLREKKTICAGRTHGMHAEPTTFGLKMAGHLSEIKRCQNRLDQALRQMAICKLSGAVGTYSTQTPKVEALVAARLKLECETVATQVIPRDRHAELFFALAMCGAALERLAVELRHLQRTEVGEVTEGFQKGQKGSSAMPHKKNPISAENLTGVARLLRSYLQAAMENIALWHERDISHSSVERVILPDAFIICDYALDRMAQLLKGLEINRERMKHNILLSQGQLFSSHLLLKLVASGLSREEAYQKVQSLSHSLRPGEQLESKLRKDKDLKGRISAKEIQELFKGSAHIEAAVQLVDRVIAVKGSRSKSSGSKIARSSRTSSKTARKKPSRLKRTKSR